jgi:ComF family protein
MLDILSTILSALLPLPPCRARIKSETSDSFVRLYTPCVTPLGTALASYQVAVVQAAITANKFYNDQHAAKLLAALLMRYIENHPAESLCLVPIPLSHQRQQERGYNQVEEVIRALPKSTQKTIISLPLLTRTRHTTPQTTLNRTKRLHNLTGAFSCSEALIPHITEGTTIILLDDVLTTGATLSAAKAALRTTLPEHITLECVALAH